MSRAEIAGGKFREGFNCAQSVLYSYAQELKIEKDMALRIATGFGGGMGRKQEVCGAVSGGIMVLGLIYGRGENDDRKKQDETYAKVRELIDAFKKEYGTICCRELLPGCVLLTEEGQKQFKENNLKEKCCGYVEQVVKILEKMASENK